MCHQNECTKSSTEKIPMHTFAQLTTRNWPQQFMVQESRGRKLCRRGSSEPSLKSISKSDDDDSERPIKASQVVQKQNAHPTTTPPHQRGSAMGGGRGCSPGGYVPCSLVKSVKWTWRVVIKLNGSCGNGQKGVGGGGWWVVCVCFQLMSPHY